MPIPAFSISGVIPPYIGPNGPGGAAADLSPYEALPIDIVNDLGRNANRRDIIRKWLAHRQRLRDLGFTAGFQWLDGSFVEEKEPNDLDVVTFTRRPPTHTNSQDLLILMQANVQVFLRQQVKAAFRLDAFFVDLDTSSENVVNLCAYYLNLFSHRRGDDLWKGMLRVKLDDAQDADAIAYLDYLDVADATAVVAGQDPVSDGTDLAETSA